MTSTLARELCNRGKRVFDVREPMLGYWNELARNFNPVRGDFLSDHNFGEDFGAHLFDDGPVTLRRDLANSFAAMLRPRNQRWFRPKIKDKRIQESAGVADWLDAAGEIMWNWIYEDVAAFVTATKSADHDFATFGNCVLSADVNRRRDGLIYRHYHLRDCGWLENSEGQVDTIFREMKLAARLIRQKWPKAALNQEITKALGDNPEREFTIWHVMMPMEDYLNTEGADEKVNRGRRGGYSWCSVYIDKDHTEVIEASGSMRFKYIVARWHPVQGWPYAISPATSDSLPAARQLQAMARTGIEALEKSVDPPSKARDKAIRGDINLFAGGITWFDDSVDEREGKSFELLDVGKNAVLGLQAIDQARLRLADAMFVTKLTMPTERAKTAYETQRIWEEQLRAAVPLFEPVEQNYNAPLLSETWEILLEVGAFGNRLRDGTIEGMPDGLKGREFTWSFSNPIQEAQERVKAQTFQVAASISMAARQLDPAAGADFDVRVAGRDAMRGAGAPEDWIVDKDEADEAAEAIGQQQQIAQAATMAGAAGDAAGMVGDGLEKLGGVI
jgi:hypothetical protein